MSCEKGGTSEAVVCVGERSWEASTLAEESPARWLHPNKKAVAKIAGDDADDDRESTSSSLVTVSRWKLSGDGFVDESLPVSICPKIQQEGGFFRYEAPQDDDRSTHWHMNFADSNVFAYYGGPLLAQDELQVVEHPILASVHRALSAGVPGQEQLTTATKDSTGATPILVKGALRRCALDTADIYGDNFAVACTDTVEQAVSVLKPPVPSNLLALSAVEPRFGMYTRDQIRELFEAAYTGFRAIVMASENKSATLHTGHWGCGAFGGNKGLSAAVQLLAAGTAGVERVCFWYGFTELDRSALMHGIEVAKLLSGKPAGEVYKLLDSAGYSWGDANENYVPFAPPAKCLLNRDKKQEPS